MTLRSLVIFFEPHSGQTGESSNRCISNSTSFSQSWQWNSYSGMKSPRTISEELANTPNCEPDQGCYDAQKTNCPQSGSPRLAQNQVGPFVASCGHDKGNRNQNGQNPKQILDRNRYHLTSASSLVRVLESAWRGACGTKHIRQIDSNSIGPQTL